MGKLRPSSGIWAIVHQAPSAAAFAGLGALPIASLSIPPRGSGAAGKTRPLAGGAYRGFHRPVGHGHAGLR